MEGSNGQLLRCQCVGFAETWAKLVVVVAVVLTVCRTCAKCGKSTVSRRQSVTMDDEVSTDGGGTASETEDTFTDNQQQLRGSQSIALHDVAPRNALATITEVLNQLENTSAALVASYRGDHRYRGDDGQGAVRSTT
jgi:hypothetical protein